MSRKTFRFFVFPIKASVMKMMRTALTASFLAGMTGGCADQAAMFICHEHGGSNQITPEESIRIAELYEDTSGWSILPPFLPGTLFRGYGRGPCGYGTQTARSWYEEVISDSEKSSFGAPRECLAKAADAVSRYKVAEKAEKGDVDAACKLAEFFATGNGTRKDGSKATMWYKKSADAGHVPAMKRLADMYNAGSDVLKDTQAASVFRRKAADAGDIESLMILGSAGDVPAMMKLGNMYAKGMSVQMNDETAIQWWEKAGKAGNREAASFIKEAEVRIKVREEQRVAAARAEEGRIEAARQAELKEMDARRNRIASLIDLAEKAMFAEKAPDGKKTTDYLAEVVNLLYESRQSLDNGDWQSWKMKCKMVRCLWSLKKAEFSADTKIRLLGILAEVESLDGKQMKEQRIDDFILGSAYECLDQWGRAAPYYERAANALGSGVNTHMLNKAGDCYMRSIDYRISAATSEVVAVAGKCYRRSAEASDVEGMLKAGLLCCDLGNWNGLPATSQRQLLASGIAWLKAAAKNGNAEAKAKLKELGEAVPE